MRNIIDSTSVSNIRGEEKELSPIEREKEKEQVLRDIRRSDDWFEIPELVRSLRSDFRNDKEIILEVVKRNGEVLKYASEELRNDKEIVLEAVKQYGWTLKYASEELRNDKEIILEAVKRNYGWALEHASEELRNDKEIILQVAKRNGFALQYASEELRNDKEIVLEVAKRDGIALEYASEELRNDKEIILEVVKRDGLALEYASEELRNDKEIVLEAVKQYVGALKYVSEELRNDKEIILEAVKRNGESLEYASEDLKNDFEVANIAIENDYGACKYVGSQRLMSEIILINSKIQTSHKFFRGNNSHLSPKPKEEVNEIRNLKIDLVRKKICFSDLKIGRLLGNGVFGRTYTCQTVWNNERTLVVKLYHHPYMGEEKKKDLLKRDSLAIPYHENVVSILYHTNLTDLNETINLKELPDYESFWKDRFEDILDDDQGNMILRNRGMILMEYHRTTLKEFCKQKKKLFSDEFSSIMLYISRGSHHLNQHKIVHRDLHLENIFINPEFGRVWIGDFGCALDLRNNQNGFKVHKNDVLMFSMTSGGGSGYSRRIGGYKSLIPPEIDPERFEYLDYEKFDLFSIGRVGQKFLKSRRLFLDQNGTEKKEFSSLFVKMTSDDPRDRYGYEAVFKILQSLKYRPRK